MSNGVYSLCHPRMYCLRRHRVPSGKFRLVQMKGVLPMGVTENDFWSDFHDKGGRLRGYGRKVREGPATGQVTYEYRFSIPFTAEKTVVAEPAKGSTTPNNCTISHTDCKHRACGHPNLKTSLKGSWTNEEAVEQTRSFTRSFSDSISESLQDSISNTVTGGAEVEAGVPIFTKAKISVSTSVSGEESITTGTEASTSEAITNSVTRQVRNSSGLESTIEASVPMCHTLELLFQLYFKIKVEGAFQGGMQVTFLQRDLHLVRHGRVRHGR